MPAPPPLPHWTSFQSSSSLVPWGRAGCPVYFPVSFPRGNFLRGGDVWFKSHLCLLSTQPRYLLISTSSRAPVDISASWVVMNAQGLAKGRSKSRVTLLPWESALRWTCFVSHIAGLIFQNLYGRYKPQSLVISPTLCDSSVPAVHPSGTKDDSW